jgi:hypothetical protein
MLQIFGEPCNCRQKIGVLKHHTLQKEARGRQVAAILGGTSMASTKKIQGKDRSGITQTQDLLVGNTWLKARIKVQTNVRRKNPRSK